ncbi:DsbA family protein [Mycolicibacterium sp. XJ870]
MRFSRVLAALLAVLALTAGCSKVIDGSALPDPRKPASDISKDGSGILIGYPDAGARIEVFTEPQCPHCAQLQQDFGEEISSYIALGQLAVTYRPMTFLDRDTDYSARVSNAMFLAAGPGTDGLAFQAFVEDLWGHQNPNGSGPSDDEMAEMARESGVGSEQVAKIAAGEESVDVQAMADQNVGFLYDVQTSISTPTVYDLINGEVLDIYDDNWLSKLMSTVKG